jgi:hypothetical protein
MTYYLTSSTFLVAYLGFAGVWGVLFRRTRENIILIIIYGMLLMLPAALMLPWQLTVNTLVWGFSLVVILLFATQPIQLPRWLWHRNFAYSYFGLLMLLILGWTAIIGQPILWLWIGLPASLTAVLVCIRVFNGNFRAGRAA